MKEKEGIKDRLSEREYHDRLKSLLKNDSTHSLTSPVGTGRDRLHQTASLFLNRNRVSCRTAEGDRPVQRLKAWLKDVASSYPSSQAIWDSDKLGSFRYCNARLCRKSSMTSA
jgi:hypothetical protein